MSTEHWLTFVFALYCHSNEARAPIANPPIVHNRHPLLFPKVTSGSVQ